MKRFFFFLTVLLGLLLVQNHLQGFRINTDFYSLMPELPKIGDHDRLVFRAEGKDAVRLTAELKRELRGKIEFTGESFKELEKVCRDLPEYLPAFGLENIRKLSACSQDASCIKKFYISSISSQEFSGELLNCDPLLVGGDGFISSFADKADPALTAGQLKGDLSTHEISALIGKLNDKYPGSQIYWTGFQKFAASSRARFDAEFTLMSVLSFIGITLVLWASFRSFIPLIISVITSLLGYLTGFMVCHALTGEVHALTLSLGGSLLGACVDYGIHWFAERYYQADQDRQTVWKEVSPVLRLGMITSIVAILPFAFSSSLLLREFLFFSAGALFGSYLALMFIPVPERKGLSKFPYQLSERICNFLSHAVSRPAVSLVILVLTVIGLARLDFNDDVRLLQKPDTELVEEAIKVYGRALPVQYVKISDGMKGEDFIPLLQKISDAGYFPAEIPGLSEQQQAIGMYNDFVSENRQLLMQTFEELGIDLRLEDKDLKTIDPFFVRKLLGSDQPLLLPAPLGVADTEKSQVINYAHKVSELFTDYRKSGIVMLVFGYLAVGIFLMVENRNLKAIFLVMPCLLAAAVTLAVTGLLGISINFFTTIILAIILGLSVDYGIFFLRSERRPAVTLSILSSSLTTIIAFMPLLLSDTQLLVSIGITMVTGVFMVTAIAPLVSVIWKKISS